MVFWQISRPMAAVCNVENAAHSTRLLASTTLRFFPAFYAAKLNSIWIIIVQFISSPAPLSGFSRFFYTIKLNLIWIKMCAIYLLASTTLRFFLAQSWIMMWAILQGLWCLRWRIFNSNVNNFSSERTVLGMKTLQEILSDRESTAEVNSQNILSFLFDAVDLLFYGWC